MIPPRTILAGGLALLALAPAAAAQGPPPAGSQPPPSPSPSPAAGRMTLSLQGTARDRGRTVALAGQRLEAVGTVTPFVEGQEVVVRVDRGSRRLVTRTLRVRRAGDRGRFSLTFSSGRGGRVTVRAVHRATPEQAGMTAAPRRVRFLTPRARPGGSGPVVRIMQRRLAALGYAVPQSGRFDGGTGRALLAYRKVNGMRRVPRASVTILRRLARGAGRFRVKFPSHGKHVEADLSRQVVVLAHGSRVHRIYHSSSGTSATPTIRGSFRFYSKTPGTNDKGMVDSAYFRGGYAIHGYPSVPTSPASHGCLRIPIPNARSVFNWIQLGDRIDVYR